MREANAITAQPKSTWSKPIPLDQVCSLEYGTRIVRRTSESGPYPVYGGGGETFTASTTNRSNRVVVSRFGMSPECVRYVAGDFFLNDSGLTVSSQLPELGQAFVDLWLLASSAKIYALGRGSAQKNLDVNNFRRLPFSYPPLQEQERIVAILDEAFEGITSAEASTQRNLNNVRDLFDSGLESRLAGSGPGWAKRLLSQLCEFKHGFAFKSEHFLADGDYVLLTPGNFYEHGGYRERGNKQKYYGGNFPREFLLAAGDLLVAMTEQAAGLLGSPIIVPDSGYFLHNQRLGLVKCRPHVPWLNRFFFYVFNTKTFRKAVHDSASGLKVRHTSPTKLGEISVSFPLSVEVQQAVVTEIEEAYSDTLRLEAIYNQKLLALSELKQSLLQQTFSGNL